MVIGLNQKRTVFEHVNEKIFCRIHNDAHSFSLLPRHDFLVNIFRKRIRDTAGQNKHILLFQSIQSAEQFLNSSRSNDRSLSVDFRFFFCFHLDIDSRQSFFQRDKVCAASIAFQHLLHLLPGKACLKAQRFAFLSQIGENNRDIIAFSSRINMFLCGSVHTSGNQVSSLHHIIQRRVKCYCIDHFLTSIIFFSFFSSLSFTFVVISHASEKFPNFTGAVCPILVESART